MHDTLKIKLLKVAIATAFLSTSATNAFADCLPSTNTDVCIEESNSGTFGNYRITNDGATPVIAFGVTNPTSTLAFTDNFGWAALAITQREWDAGQRLNFYTGSEDFGGPIPNTDLFSPPSFIQDDLAFFWNTNDLGTYADLFGTEETTVNFYWQEAYPAIESGDVVELGVLLANGITINGFQWDNNRTFSNFVAFNANQGIVARTPMTTTPSAVPVPAALPLMASALGMFGIARRQKNK